MNTAKRVIVNFVALHGGGTAYSFEMTKGLVENGCEVYAIVSSKMDNLKEWRNIKGLNLIEVSGYDTKFSFATGIIKFYLYERYKIRKIAKEFNPDVIYIPFVSFFTRFVENQLRGFRSFYTMHDVYPHDGKGGFIWNVSQKEARRAEKIIILSNCFREDVKNTYHLEDRNVLTLPHGNYFKENIVKKADDGLVHFVFFGNIVEYKGIRVLLQAFSKVITRRTNVRLLIAGSGDFSPYYEEYSKIDSDKVSLINRWIDDSEITSFFEDNRSVCVLPYINATQSGVIPLAMHLKSLILSTDCSGLVEQVEDGNTGYLIPANDVDALTEKMIDIVDNWEDRSKVVQNAFEHIDSLKWENITKKLVENI